MRNIIYGVMIGVGASLLAYNYYVEDLPYSKEQRAQLDSLRSKSDSLDRASKRLVKEISDLEQQASLYDEEIADAIDRINSLNRQIYEKSSIIDSLSISDLQMFFTTRYSEQRNASGPLNRLAKRRRR